MKKVAEVLQGLNPEEQYYKEKVGLLYELINNPNVGHLCPDKLVDWCKKVGLKTENNCEDRASWWTVTSNSK